MKILCKTLFFAFAAFLVSCTTDADDEWNAADVCPESKRGTFVDERDGQVYRYTTIGKQVWMAQNLNYDVRDDACYYEEDDCKTMGRVYFWNAASCPAGWHLPSLEEWRKMFKTLEGEEKAAKRLKATYSWVPLNREDEPNGTDDCGFSAVFGINGRNDDGLESGFLTSTVEYSRIDGTPLQVTAIMFRSYPKEVQGRMDAPHYSSFYVRCVKD